MKMSSLKYQNQKTLKSFPLRVAVRLYVDNDWNVDTRVNFCVMQTFVILLLHVPSLARKVGLSAVMLVPKSVQIHAANAQFLFTMSLCLVDMFYLSFPAGKHKILRRRTLDVRLELPEN